MSASKIHINTATSHDCGLLTARPHGRLLEQQFVRLCDKSMFWNSEEDKVKFT